MLLASVFALMLLMVLAPEVFESYRVFICNRMAFKLLLKGCVAHPDWYTWNSHLLRLHSAQGASAAVLLEHH